MAKYNQAPTEVIEIAKRLISEYYPDLQDASIGFLMRDIAPESGGRVTYGQAKKIGPIEREFMDYDFIIWLAEDRYLGLTYDQREALIDHELMHCIFAEGKAKIRPHDVEEFADIIRRHGLWWPGASDFKDAIYQMPLLETDGQGRVEAVVIPGGDVWDQLGDLDFS